MHKPSRHEVAVGIVGFLVFSAVVFLLGLLIGVYDYDPTEDGYIEQVYHAPIGDRRY